MQINYDDIFRTTSLTSVIFLFIPKLIIYINDTFTSLLISKIIVTYITTINIFVKQLFTVEKVVNTIKL